MIVFVVTIYGRGVVAIGAPDRIAAEDVLADEAFQTDLLTLEHEGVPLWNGSDDLALREPSPAEFASFEATFRKTGAHGVAEDVFVAYLVAVTGPG